MPEYVMSVAARHSRCMECERTPCVEIGCEIAPQVFTARHKDKVIRCRNCKKRGHRWLRPNGDGSASEVSCELVEPDGFCKWGEE